MLIVHADGDGRLADQLDPSLQYVVSVIQYNTTRAAGQLIFLIAINHGYPAINGRLIND